MEGIGQVKERLGEMAREVWEPVTVPLVSHYTGLGSLPKLLRDPKERPEVGLGSLWATSVRFLNDRQEFLWGWERFREAIKSVKRSRQSDFRLEDIADKIDNDDVSLGLSVYSVSFSGETDDLGQWRGYADNGYGASLLFLQKDLNESLGALPGTVCGPVLYDAQVQRTFAQRLVHALIESNSIADEVVTALQVAAVFMKHVGFQGEREYRVVRLADDTNVRVRESRRKLVPYLDLLSDHTSIPLQGVVLGPAWQLGTLTEAEFQRHHVTLGVRRALDLYGLDAVPVERSAIPYDPS